MIIPITNRAREYGYVFWTKKMDSEVLSFLGGKEQVNLWFENSLVGEKKVDRKYRRISIGYKFTRALSSEKKQFVLAFKDNGDLQVTCK